MKISRATPIGHDLSPAGEASSRVPIVRPPAVAESSDADVAEWLFAEFEPTVGLRMLSDVVRRCRVARRAAPARSPRASVSSLEDLAREAIASFVLASPAARVS